MAAQLHDGPAPPGGPSGSTVGHRLLRAVHHVIDSDAVLVTLMAAVVGLSALSVHQATLASDRADGLIDDARLLEAQTARESGYVRTLITHDLDVLGPYCAATIERDVGRVQLLSVDADVRHLVSADLDLRALHPLLQADRPEDPCAAATVADPAQGGYSVARAQQSVAAAQPQWQQGTTRGNGGVIGATRQAEHLSAQERHLMSAGLLFAAALFGFIAVDVLGNRSKRPARLARRTTVRWQRGALGLSAVAAVAGGVLLAGNVVDPTWLLIPLALLSAVIGWRVRSVSRAARTPDDGVSADSPEVGSPVGAPHWWAEVAGAVTLVAFSAAALGLSYASTVERDERALAERQDAVARGLEEQGEQAALRDFSVVAQLARLEAEVAGANQASAVGVDPPSEDGEELQARRDEVAARRQSVEESVRAQTDEIRARTAARDGTQGPCNVDLTRPTETPEDLLSAGGSDEVYAYHLAAYQESATRCDVLSSLTRDGAARWGIRASHYTVALVTLGLAGFLLALAADPDRSRRSARWLLLVGSGGAVVGIAMSGWVLVDQARTARSPDAEERLALAGDVAAGRHRPCDVEQLERVDAAVERFPDYGPGLVVRANVRLCRAAEDSGGVVLSSALDPDHVPSVLRDYRAAVGDGVVTPSTRANLGWLHIVQALLVGTDREGNLLRGLELTEAAVRDVERSLAPAPTHVHAMRFNVALAEAALDRERAALDTYRHAVECLDPDTGCSGGGLEDQRLRELYVLWALADLELLDESVDADSFREQIIGTLHQTPAQPAGWTGGELDVFGQELQVSGGGGSPAPQVVVWYYRPDESTPWGVLEEASMATLRPGAYLDRTTPAGQFLPAGDYRADLYAGATKTHSVVTPHTPHGLAVRWSSHPLGISAVAPEGWVDAVPTKGVDWLVGPPDSFGFSVTRLESQEPAGDVATFLDEQLDAWAGSWLESPAEEPVQYWDQYFLGLGDVVVREYPEQRTVAAAGFAPYASGPACGGALFMAVVGGRHLTPEVVDDVFQSFVLDVPAQRLPPVVGRYESDVFAVDIPEGWDAAGRPPGGVGDALTAKDCETTTNLLVNHDTLGERTVASEVDDSIEAYAAEFAGFRLEDREPVQVPGADDAVAIRFTWQADTGPVHQRQLFASDGQTLLYATFTAHLDAAAEEAAVADALMTSFELREAADTG